MTGNILQEIEKYLKGAPITASTFGRKAVDDGKLVERLRNGGQVLPTTEKRIRDFIKNN